MTTLLSMIWRDEAGPPEACAEVRHVMGLQVWPHRLTAAFPDGVALAGKTGTLPSVYNEVAVVTYPDGTRYAVAVYTRSSSYALRQPAMDRVIGQAGFLAIEALRS
jgi:beta-lactamase class A